jgi:hypothetical protein
VKPVSPTPRDRQEYELGRVSGRLDAQDGLKADGRSLRHKTAAYREGYTVGYQEAQKAAS